MYYGYERMWTLFFLPLGFVVVMVGGLAFTGAYAVGVLRGGRAALTYTRTCLLVLAVALAATVAFGVADGQWTLFVQWYGGWPIVEIALLAFMWLASMWLMAESYSRGRLRQDMRERGERGIVDERTAGSERGVSEVQDA